MGRTPFWAEATKHGDTIYQLTARKGSGVGEFVILWNHAKHAFEAVALLGSEPTSPGFVFTRIVSPGAYGYYECRILPNAVNYEPDQLLRAIATFADVPTCLRGALVQDRNRSKLARQAVANTPDMDLAKRASDPRRRWPTERFSGLSADRVATRDAAFA